MLPFNELSHLRGKYKESTTQRVALWVNRDVLAGHIRPADSRGRECRWMKGKIKRGGVMESKRR